MNEENLTHLNRTTSLKKVIANNERVELNLPFKGSNSANLLRKKLVEIVRKSYPTVKTSVIFFHQSQPFPIKNRDLQKASNIIYKFTCGCGSSYVGKTTQRLKTRIRQHVPVALRRNLGKTTRSKLTEKQRSAVGNTFWTTPDAAGIFTTGCSRCWRRGGATCTCPCSNPCLFPRKNRTCARKASREGACCGTRDCSILKLSCFLNLP